VFTDAAALAEGHLDPVPHVEVSLAFALAAWPADRGLRVNPGRDDGFELPAEHVLPLLGFTSSPTPPEPR
jgi:hypothetical protein